MVDSTERAYVAGVMDGEGCIGLTKKNNGYSNCYRYYVEISNSNLEMLEWIQDRFGGHIRHAHYNTFLLEWHSKGDIYNLLELLEEFMIVKKSEALAMLDFCATPSSRAELRSVQCGFITSAKQNYKLQVKL